MYKKRINEIIKYLKNDQVMKNYYYEVDTPPIEDLCFKFEGVLRQHLVDKFDTSPFFFGLIEEDKIKRYGCFLLDMHRIYCQDGITEEFWQQEFTKAESQIENARDISVDIALIKSFYGIC